MGDLISFLQNQPYFLHSRVGSLVYINHPSSIPYETGLHRHTLLERRLSSTARLRTFRSKKGKVNLSLLFPDGAETVSLLFQKPPRCISQEEALY